MSSNFEKVKQFMFIAGQDETTADLSNKQLCNFRLDLIKEELQELEEAITNKDRKEVIDALGDILYVVYGASKVFDINIDEAFNRIHQSNMSKFCDTEEDAVKTVEKYRQELLNSTNNNNRYESPTYEKRGEKWVVFNKSTGKILKNWKWRAPIFEHI